MSRWFRFYDDALDDPKVQRLAPHLFRTWINLLCLASKTDGKLPGDDDIAFRLRMSVQDAAQQIEDLILAGLVDIDGKGGRTPHNWQQRQFASDSSKERTRKWRKRKRNTAGDVTVTDGATAGDAKSDAIESYTETEEDTLGLPSSLDAAGARDDDDRKVLNRFGRRKDGGRQEKLVRRAEGLGLPVDELIEAVNRHKAKNRPAYFTRLCVEWLQARLPGLDEQLIRDALWDKDPQYAAITKLVMEAP